MSAWKACMFLIFISVIINTVTCYYTSRRCYGTGDCHLFTKNQDGGFDDAQHQWLVECNDGEGTVAIRDDDTHFEGISGIWCSFLFPLKEAARGSYPYYPSCITRNLTAGEYHCRNAEQPEDTNTTQLFVTGVYKDPDDRRVFTPSSMKCCEVPTGYRIDNSRCYYKKTFDRFGEHYTGEWLVKCDTHHVITGIGKDVNPWDNKEHFTWIQCCPFTYVNVPTVNYPAENSNPESALVDQLTAAAALTNLNDPKYLSMLSQELLNYNLGQGTLGDTAAVKDREGFKGPLPRVDFPSETIPQRYKNSIVLNPYMQLSRSSADSEMYKFPSAILREIQQKQQAEVKQKLPPVTFVNQWGTRSGSGGDAPMGMNQYYPKMLLQMQQLGMLNLTGQYFPPTTTTPEPVTRNDEMSAIQHAANVAAYNQFLSTFNQLLSTYRNQPGKPDTPQTTPATFPAGQMPVSVKTNNFMPFMAELRSLSGTGNPGRVTSGVDETTSQPHYVPFPLPSGLQNYLLLASKNPAMALSQLYADEQLPIPTNDIDGYLQYTPTTPRPQRITSSWKDFAGLEQLLMNRQPIKDSYAQKATEYSRPITLDSQLANKWLESLLFKQTPAFQQPAPVPVATVPHYEGSLVYQIPVSVATTFAPVVTTTVTNSSGITNYSLTTTASSNTTAN